MKYITIAFGSRQNDLDESDGLFRAELAKMSPKVQPLRWDAIDSNVAQDSSAIVFRSVWDYPEKIEEFRHWVNMLQSNKTLTINCLDLVAWNMDKKYLSVMSKTGILIPKSILPLTWQDVISFVHEHDAEKFVIKPRIGGSGLGVNCFTKGEVLDIKRSPEEDCSDIIVQTFCPEIFDGELSFIFIGGTYCHSILRKPNAPEFRVHRKYGGFQAVRIDPPDGLVQQAEQILEKLPSIPDYARVDAFQRDGLLICSEIELIDPNLFLHLAPETAKRLAEVVVKKVAASAGDSGSGL
ncbi:hypothetical protein LJR245_007567 [Rhizobium leguminosarum]|uniref:ATP-grasp domain-containing protein n=1 Tax=Rhizobium leguminosarum TaxID=384 RepID=UPI003ECD6B9B